MSNNPISFVDPDGGWDFGITYYVDGMKVSSWEGRSFLSSGEFERIDYQGSSGNWWNGLAYHSGAGNFYNITSFNAFNPDWKELPTQDFVYNYGQEKAYSNSIVSLGQPSGFGENYPPSIFPSIPKSIRPIIIARFEKTNNPKRLKDLGTTTLLDLSRKFNPKTNMFDIFVKFDLNLSPLFLDKNSELLKQNPGLDDEVIEHEFGHVAQIMETISENVLVGFEGKAYRGRIDNLINEFFLKEIEILEEQNTFVFDFVEHLTKIDIKINNFIQVIGKELSTKLALKLSNQSFIEKDANDRAKRKFEEQGKVYQYGIGKKPVKFNGKILN